jgi:hypothetical protein
VTKCCAHNQANMQYPVSQTDGARRGPRAASGAGK